MKTCNVLIVDDHPLICKVYTDILISQNLNDKGDKFNVYYVTSMLHAVEKVASKINVFDLALLDISIPKCKKYNLNSGEDLGLLFKEKIPDIKIIAITSLNDNLRLTQIMKNLNPDGLLIKSDIDNNLLLQAVNTVIEGNHYYSNTVINLLRNKMNQQITLDAIDIKIIRELSNGAKMRELTSILPLTKSGIEKRKRQLKIAFGIKTNSDRDLVLTAREKGFI